MNSIMKQNSQPEAADILVPKMILQPLAGNAYKHGNVCRKETAISIFPAPNP